MSKIVAFGRTFVSRMSAISVNEGPVANRIRQKLTQSLKPTHLEIICESHLHNVPKESERHFRVVVVCEKFEGLPLIKRHRLVNEALSEELKGPLHALTIDAYAPKQYAGQNASKSPPCMGGGSL